MYHVPARTGNKSGSVFSSSLCMVSEPAQLLSPPDFAAFKHSRPTKSTASTCQGYATLVKYMRVTGLFCLESTPMYCSESTKRNSVECLAGICTGRTAAYHLRSNELQHQLLYAHLWNPPGFCQTPTRPFWLGISCFGQSTFHQGCVFLSCLCKTEQHAYVGSAVHCTQLTLTCPIRCAFMFCLMGLPQCHPIPQ